jgi:halocyanin-like protein
MLDTTDSGTDRRTFLASTSALTVGTLVGLTGCAGNGDDGGDGNGDDGGDGNGDDGENGNGDDGGDGNGDDGENGGDDDGNGEDDDRQLSGDDYPAVDEWLTETEIGGADDSYDGEIVDERGADSVSVDVGSEGNGGAFAFGPSAVAVSPGTTVVWEWTGNGGLHNVEAEPEDQLGESDYEFGSGDPVSEAGTTFEFTFDESGIALYHCEPHLAVGMKGAVVVVS